MTYYQAYQIKDKFAGLIAGESLEEIEQKAKEHKVKLYGEPFKACQQNQISMTRAKRKQLYGF